MSGSRFFTGACLAVLLVAAMLGTVEAQAVPEGTPYILTNITATGGFDEADVRAKFAEYIVSAFSTMNNIVADNIGVYDVTIDIATDVTQMSIAIKNEYASNSKAYIHLEDIVSPMQSNNVFGSAYTTSVATLYENAASQVTITFDRLHDAYNASWSPDQRVWMDFSPSKDTYIDISFTNADVETEPSPIRIMWPEKEATFRLRANTPERYTMNEGFTGNDTMSRYNFNGSVTIPEFTNRYDENITITAPDPTIVTYRLTPSEDFTIRVPSTYRDETMKVMLGVTSDPPMNIKPRNIPITKRDETYSFHVEGPQGVYTLSYHIDDPFNDASEDNKNFYNPSFTHTIVIEDSLNITTSKIPRGYMINQPIDGTLYGGAFTRDIPVHLERAPKSDLSITIEADDVVFTPSVLTFASNRKFLTYRARAFTQGKHTVKFTLGGSSSADYYTIKDHEWIVGGANPHCLENKNENDCWDMLACQWNEDHSLCSNHTLPIAIGNIPELFDSEPSVDIPVHLPTKVRSGLTIEFVATAHLTFTPAQITLGAGESDFNFTVVGSLESNTRVQQPFYLRLSGPDANLFDQQVSYAFVRPKILCTVAIPANFFVNTESDEFVMTCDTAPETDVTITPQPSTGISFVSSGAKDNGMYLDDSSTTGKFIAISSGSVTGSFTIPFQITGTNAARFATVVASVERPIVTIIILPSGEVLTPPTFYQTAYEWSPEFHMDITVVSPKPLEVAISILNLDGSNASTTDPSLQVVPNMQLYNGTKRGMVKVYGTVPGEYMLVFNISGVNSRNYVEPQPMKFFIMDRLDGSAFTARLELGFVPTARCRVNIGRNSQVFKGQDPIDDEDEFCFEGKFSDDKKPNHTATSYDCGQHVTEERCRNGLAETGWICVWHVVDSTPQCIHLPELQGNTTSVAYGSGFTLLKDVHGEVWSIGRTRYGQLGHYNNHLTKVNIELPEAAQGEVISQIVAGTSHSMALSTWGRLYAWGVNSRGQLGVNSKVMQTSVPTLVPFPKGENITCITAGTVHSGAVSISGKVFMWGANDYGQLGSEASYRGEKRIPTPIGRDLLNGDPVQAVQAGEYHTMVATDIGVYAFGSNFMGQLGRPGFDEWRPASPIHYVLNKYRSQPTYKSYISGPNECKKDEDL